MGVGCEWAIGSQNILFCKCIVVNLFDQSSLHAYADKMTFGCHSMMENSLSHIFISVKKNDFQPSYALCPTWQYNVLVLGLAQLHLNLKIFSSYRRFVWENEKQNISCPIILLHSMSQLYEIWLKRSSFDYWVCASKAYTKLIFKNFEDKVVIGFGSYSFPHVMLFR